MARVIMIGCMKGGCGKTDSDYNLAYSLKKRGKKVLCVEFDSQGNLSTCFGIENTAEETCTIGHLMMARIEEDEVSASGNYIQSREGVD